jgi:Cd2+/Zn2+-exporting ATPase
MDCADEIAVLRREIGPIVGGARHLSFDLLNGRMIVRASATRAAPSAIVEAVARTGMSAERWSADGASVRRSWIGKHGREVSVVVSAATTTGGLVVHAVTRGSFMTAFAGGETDPTPLAARVLYAVAVLAGLWLVLPKALFALRRLRADMNLLMVVAVAGALAIDQWLEAATVTFLFALSIALEAWSVVRARRAVEALLSVAAPSARVQRDGAEHVVAPSDVHVGERVVVRPGERLPLDGKVVDGTSEVNQAPITGESVPVTKSRGAEVFAGTVNGDGALVLEVTRAADDTTLAHIVRSVADAQSRRGASEQWVEKFAAYYTPTILAIAILVVLVPTLAGASFDVWLYRGLVLLVIGCPCSLVISTPVTIVASIASAARSGVLVKGGPFVELPATLAAIALDKTGTLTAGKPRVVEVVPLGGHDERELLERASALEQRSTHPLARAIVEYAAARGVQPAPAEDLRLLQGKGASGRFGDKTYWVGSHRYLEERGQETPEVHAALEALSASGKTAVVIGNDTHVCGLFALADAVRDEAVTAITRLRAAGVQRVVMLTGDSRGTAAIVARAAGVDDVEAELLPEDKVAAIERLIARYGTVAMVGDGVNDAPALARATVGVAMGAAGSDAAIETADVALMSDDLGKLAWLVGHSRRTLGVVRQNIVFSLVVKAAFVLLALGGVSSLWMAIAADTGASLLVTLNGLRLLRDVDGRKS